MASKNTRHAENMIGRQTHNVGFSAVPVPGTVTVDGCFDDWDLSGQILCCADSGIRDIFSVKAAAMSRNRKRRAGAFRSAAGFPRTQRRLL